ncbi:TPR end-of-group domain-containing protein [Methylocucumis oryzae]|uniref:Uncharacterized protein n=1 Tax=Methylocucumis oryzae TaxID=1632867 RepID=A0A0F3IHV6_9GAMM|nr:hypothetical protein [Methylocucumis oryzae]KJV06385.1 hypothetical protein VZ94_11655 [Methylocucumis oryzae]
MQILSIFQKRSKLDATIRQTAQARKSEGSVADSLFKGAYQGFAEVMLDDSLRADTLYHWGFALLHQAKTKSDSEAEKLYLDAIKKFEFCMLINPSYLGAAINGGVAYMDLARLKQVAPADELYELALTQFETANAIHKGTASYNLACIYALRNEQEACLNALEFSRDHGSLPDTDEILHDPDMTNVLEQDWFINFIDNLPKKAVPVAKTTTAPTEEPAATEGVSETTETASDESV